MRLEQLRYIIEIADTGSFTLASNRLFIAQPSISQAVTALEKELNVTLFTRYRTGAVPTQVGLQVIAKARIILQNVGEIERLSSNDFSQIRTKINIGTIPTFGSVLLPEVISVYRKTFANVSVKIKEAGTEKLIRDVLTRECDLAMISLHEKRSFDEKLLFQRIVTGRLMAYVSKDSSLSNRKQVSFRDLLPHQLMLYGEDFALHKYCHDQISQYGTPNIISTTHNPESIKRFVMKTDAVGFGPDISLRDDIYVTTGSIVPIEISDASSIEFGLLINKTRKPNVAVDALIKMILEQASTM